MSIGFIKIHRTVFDNWVADEPEALAVWVRILSEANFADKKKKFNGSLIEVKRGQMIFGLNAFSDRSGVSVMKLRRIISDLESDGMINRQKTNRYSLLTVVAYDSYQGLTSQEQAINTPLTDKQHADNTPLTTLEEGKKGISKESKNKDLSPAAPKFNFKRELIGLGVTADKAVEWMAIRKTKKASNTEQAFNTFANNLGNFTIQQAVDHCCLNQWKGFNPEWVKNTSNHSTTAKPNQYNKYNPDPNQPKVIEGELL